MKLDKKDRKLLFFLDENARYSNLELSKKVGLSKDAIQYRINRLTHAGVITGYRALIDWNRLGYLSYRIGVELVNTTPKIEEEIVAYLADLVQVPLSSLNEGVWTLSFLAIVKHPRELYSLDNKLMNKYRQYIANRHITQLLCFEELPRSYLLDKKNSNDTPVVLTTDTVSIDDLDKKILDIIVKNARMKLVELAQAVGSSSMVVHNRLKKLQMLKVIRGYKANLNVLKIDKDYYGVKIILNSYQEYQALITYIRNLSEITAFMYTVGPYDLEFDLEVDDTNHYRQIIADLKNTFTSIRKIDYLKTRSFTLFDA